MRDFSDHSPTQPTTFFVTPISNQSAFHDSFVFVSSSNFSTFTEKVSFRLFCLRQTIQLKMFSKHLLKNKESRLSKSFGKVDNRNLIAENETKRNICNRSSTTFFSTETFGENDLLPVFFNGCSLKSKFERTDLNRLELGARKNYFAPAWNRTQNVGMRRTIIVPPQDTL